MTSRNLSVWFLASALSHVLMLSVLVYSVEFHASLPVFQNTNKTDVISAVILGDTVQSKILPEPVRKPLPLEKQNEKVLAPIKPKDVAVKQEVIILKKLTAEKKLAQLKAEEERKKRELLAKDLLAEIKKETTKQHLQQERLQAQFKKTLREQAEKSFRQELIKEDIFLKNRKNRDSQGTINKYKALIIQAISSHWLVPASANKKLYCQLLIKLAPSGMVLDVQITKSSGDISLDGSARAAVLKASPLPVPSEKETFKPFKEFVLKVKPENIIDNDAMVSAQ